MNGGRRGRVVVADGDDEVRRLLRVKLGAAGFEVVEAASAAEVRAAVRPGLPDVLLCEARLADGDAADLFAELRSAPGGGRPVLVVLDGLETDAAIDAALAAGADDLVAKPFSPSEVILRLRIGLARRALEAAAAPGAPAAGTEVEAAPCGGGG